MTELEVRAGEELERKMERYARVRLEPSSAQAKRARSVLMEAAWRERLASPSAPAAVPSAEPGNRPARGPFAGWSVRRLGVSFAAAVLAGLLVGTTAFATSRAGGPLYAVRVAFEELTLPADPQARLEAEIGLAQGRLSEILDAVSRDDPGAVSAAVQAYLGALDDLDESTGGPADRALDAIRYHETVLATLLTTAPDDARAGIENAITRSSAVIERLDAAGTPAPNGAGTGGNGNGTGGGNGTGTGAGAGAGAGQGGRPDPSAGPANPGGKPSKDPRPARTPAPAGNEHPAKTHAPAATAAPGGGGTGQQP